MRAYIIIVRSKIHMGRPVTDYDLRCMDCYYESPVFYADPNQNPIEIIETALKCFCTEQTRLLHAESVELVPRTQS